MVYSISTMAFANVQVQPDIAVCPATDSQLMPLDFIAKDCQTMKFNALDPRNAQVWVRAIVDIPEALYQQSKPLGIFISGKASSTVYLNGTLVGGNGSPGNDRATEVPGKMDAVVFAPRSTLNVGKNVLVLKMSGHYGFWDLVRPIHWLGMGEYGNPTSGILEHYWKSLLPFGILLLGAVYFGVASFRQKESWSNYLLPLMALFTAGQLCAEVARGLFAYTYPFHDVRLAFILMFSFGFGLSLLSHTLTVLAVQARTLIFLLGSLLTIGIISVTDGFDNKSTLATGIPLFISLALALYQSFQKQPQAIQFAAGISVFLLTILLTPMNFLDIYFFYIVAGLVTFLFIQQLAAFSKERAAKTLEKARADRLQLIIDQNHLNASDAKLQVKSAGKTELVAISNIVYCKGAGDYVELVLEDGGTILYSDSMAELERTLPTTFLRIHRSYIVNTSMISSVERKKSGVGRLVLNNQSSIPISRRIMPSVKDRFVSELCVTSKVSA